MMNGTSLPQVTPAIMVFTIVPSMLLNKAAWGGSSQTGEPLMGKMSSAAIPIYDARNSSRVSAS